MSRDWLFEELELYFPSVAEEAVSWYEKDLMLHITLNNGRRMIYDHIGNTIRTLPQDSMNITEEECLREFAIRFRAIMGRKGFTQQMLSEKTGIPQSVISRYLNGRSMPGLYNIDKIAKVLNCSVDEFRYKD